MNDRGWMGYLEAVFATVCCAAIAWLLDPILETANLGLVFLAGVLVSAVRAGVGPALLASCLSFVSFNFLFTDPRYTFFVWAKQDILTLTFFLLVALVTGQLAARVRRQIDTIQASNRRIAALEGIGRRLTGIVGCDDLSSVLVEHIRSTINLCAIVLFMDSAEKCSIVAGGTTADLTDDDRSAAEWTMARHEPAGRGTDKGHGSQWFFMPIGRREAIAILGVKPASKDGRIGHEQQRLLLAMCDQAGTALERVQLAEAMERTRLLTETERLRSALLSSVSHDLRTPLVSIKGAATALLQLEATLAATDKKELLENVVEETDRLNRYVQNLLDMTRLGYGAVQPQCDWRDVREIIGEARRVLRHALEGRSIEIMLPTHGELVHTDATLLEQVLVNLLENAAKYSPGDTLITICGHQQEARFDLSVCDEGTGIPYEEREHIFDLFRRANAVDQRSTGTGMGLAICRGFIEALGGSIRVSGRKSGPGTCFQIQLPQPGRPSIAGSPTE